jgi:hypothetical protein
MDPDQTARMHRLVWIHAGRKRITLVLSWLGSNVHAIYCYKQCPLNNAHAVLSVIAVMILSLFYCNISE